MEREIVKLLNVLRRIARAARYIEWTRSAPESTQFCIAQYNRILARLSELEPAIKPLFTPLSDSASPEVIRMAARELLAYFEVEEPMCFPAVPRKILFGCGRRSARLPWAAFSTRCD